MDKTRLTKQFQQALKIHGSGDPGGAEPLYREIVRSLPEFADAWYLWGLAAHELGEHEDAAARFARSISLGANLADSYHYMGLSLQALGRLQAAMDSLLQALELVPDNPGYMASLGSLAMEKKELDLAESWYLQALSIQEAFPQVHYNLATLYREQQKNDQALHHFKRTLVLDPGHWKAHFNLGLIEQLSNRTDEALRHYDAAIRLKPDYWRAVWAKHTVLPTFYVSQDDVAPARHRWLAGVAELEKIFHPSQAKSLEEARHACESTTNFYLHYQGYNDLDAQRAQGRLLTRIAHLVYPGHDQPLHVIPPKPGEKIHVAFVSSFLHGHSVYKTHSRFVTLLNRQRFFVSVVYTGTIKDDSLHYVIKHADGFHDVGANSSRLLATIHMLKPQVLIYTDLGMDPIFNLVSALRLAPIQCNAGGHPITSGLANMDYFLSSDAMESDRAQEHYSETLIRLPNLAHCYPTPASHLAVTPQGAERNTDGVVFCNLQNMIKLLPKHDWIYAAIARAVPNSQFWFIDLGGHIGDLFRDRLKKVFSAQGLDYELYCRLFPRMELVRFFGLIQAADIVLDGISWSGNNSSMEALSLNKPIVTFPGELFRSRHTHGILKRLGIQVTQASSLEDYVAIAIRLAQDIGFRNKVVQSIAAAKSVLYEDQEPVRGLERALESIVGAGCQLFRSK